MAEITYREALNQALAEEMERDPDVFLMGEEVGLYNGAYKVSKGLLDRFGETRVVEERLQGAFDDLAFLEPPWRVWRGRAAGDPSRVLVATMRAETCRDSMSGRRFDHRGVLSFPNGAAETGCCSITLDPDAATSR